jgi:hypothetical protein
MPVERVTLNSASAFLICTPLSLAIGQDAIKLQRRLYAGYHDEGGLQQSSLPM